MTKATPRTTPTREKELVISLESRKYLLRSIHVIFGAYKTRKFNHVLAILLSTVHVVNCIGVYQYSNSFIPFGSRSVAYN